MFLRKKKLSMIFCLALAFCLLFQSLAMAAPGYIVCGTRYLSSDVASNNSMLQQLNAAIAQCGIENLIVDLGTDSNPIVLNYKEFIAAGGLQYPGGYQQYAIDHPATVPTGTVIIHPDGTTTPDPAAQIDDAQVAAAVDEAITALPAADALTLDDKAAVEAVRASYDALTEAQKALVTGLATLQAAEDKIAALQAAADNEALQAAIVDAQNAILALPANITLADQEAVNNAIAKYDIAIAKGATDAKIGSNLVALLNNAAAKIVTQLIEAIPAEITLDAKAAVETARDAYDNLTQAQQALVGNYSVLQAAEATIAQLEGALDEKTAAIQAAKAAIIELPVVENLTTGDEDAVNAAKAKYEAAINLGATDEEIGTTLVSILNAAIQKIADLKQAQADADEAAADEVRLLILNTLKPVDQIKLVDKPLAEAARDAYDALTPAQQALGLLAPAYAHLEAVEAQIEKIEKAVADAEAAIVAADEAMTALLDIENTPKDVLSVEQLVIDARELVDAALALDQDAVIEGIELLTNAEAQLVTILTNVNNANTEPKLLSALIYFKDVNADLINLYRAQLGSGHVQNNLTAVQDVINDINEQVAEENEQARLLREGAELLAALKGAPNQIALLNLLNENFPGIIDADLINEYEAVIDGLSEPITKQDIQKELVLVNDIAAATAAVEAAEASKAQADVNAAQALVTALPTGADKDALQARLDAVQDAIDLAAATAAVEAAEASKAQDDVAAAQELVTALPTGADKDALQARLNAVQADINLAKATAAVRKAETSELQADVDAARALVNNLPTSGDKIGLQARLDAVQQVLNAKAEAAVAKAEGSNLQADVNTAKALVDALPEGSVKAGLLTRLAAVQDIIDKNAVSADLAELIEYMEGSGNNLNNAPNITRTLASSGANGSTITWGALSGSGTNAASINGTTLTLTFPNSGEKTWTSTITATLTKGNATEEVTFTIRTQRYTEGIFIIRDYYNWSISAS